MAFWDYKGYSIGYGHLGANQGDTITRPAAMALLEHDLIPVHDQVLSVVEVPITQNQHNALVSFVYNLGLGCLVHGEVLSCLDKGDIEGCTRSWLLYNHAGGKVLPALTARRYKEVQVFLGKA